MRIVGLGARLADAPERHFDLRRRFFQLGPALMLAGGFAMNLSTRLVRGGERVIRPVTIAAVLAVFGGLLGLY